MSKQSKMLERIQYTGWMLVIKDAGPVCVATERSFQERSPSSPAGHAWPLQGPGRWTRPIPGQLAPGNWWPSTLVHRGG